jgi:hypothetical protein
MGRSSLSVCCMTADPPAQVAAALAALRPVADEIVVAADSRVDPGLLGAYDGVADRVVRFDYRPPVDRPRAWLAAQCSADWMLSIDGDEVASQALVDALPELLAARDVVQYWLPRRWLYPDPTTWLGETPWWPDFQVRLARTGATLVARAELHGGFLGMLPARHVDAPLYHLDCLLNDEASRTAKAERYESEAPGRTAYGGGGLNDVMYRPERWASAPLRPVPAEDRVRVGAVLSARAGAPVAGPASPRSGAPGLAGVPADSAAAAVVPAAEIDALASSPVLAEGDYAVGLALFDDPGGPVRLAPGEVRPLHVRVRNRGGATWRWGLEQQPEIRVSYHWRSVDGEVHTYEGLRSPLPCPLGPGETAIVPVWVEVPAEPGGYRLEIDLVHEHVRWFETPLRVDVAVAARESTC